MPKFPENKSPFMMGGMAFKEGQSPMKKLSLASLKEGIKKIGSKIKAWKQDPKNKKKVKAIKTAGDALSAAGERLATYDPGEIEMGPTGASVPSQSPEVPDIENIVPRSTPITPITKKYKK